MTLYMYFEVVLLRRLYAKCGRRSAQGIGELSSRRNVHNPFSTICNVRSHLIFFSKSETTKYFTTEGARKPSLQLQKMES